MILNTIPRISLLLSFRVVSAFAYSFAFTKALEKVCNRRKVVQETVPEVIYLL